MTSGLALFFGKKMEITMTELNNLRDFFDLLYKWDKQRDAMK